MPLRQFAFRCAALALALVILELTLSFAALVSPHLRYQLTPPWKRKVLLPSSDLGFRMEPSYPGNDARGFRNPSALTRCDVLAIGDSMTYGFAAPPEKCWPRVLADQGGVSVYNMSCGDYSPCEYNMLVERGLELHPDQIVICLYLGNDMSNAYRTVHRHKRAQEFNNVGSATIAKLEEAEKQNPFGQAFLQQVERMKKAEGRSTKNRNW